MVGFWKYLIPKDVNAMLKSILVRTANGKPQTASRRLLFPVNAMLKVSIVFIRLQIFFAARAVLKIGNITRIFPSFNWGIFGHVARLD